MVAAGSEASRIDPLRVLVVDDEALIRWSLVETLTAWGHQVSEAADGRSAIRALEADDVDVVLLDYRLPDSDDLNLLTKVRQVAPRAAVILMTAFGTPAVLKGAVDLGAYCVLSKPFEVSDLPTLMSQATAARRQ
jgi:two-component system response regulator AtoC